MVFLCNIAGFLVSAIASAFCFSVGKNGLGAFNAFLALLNLVLMVVNLSH